MPQTVQDQSFMKQRPILPLLLSMALPMVLFDAGQLAVQHC